jgi:ATP-dependent DNA helicase RecQ
LQTSTVVGHLAEALEAGEDVDIDRLIVKPKRDAIAAAFDKLGSVQLRPVLDHLGDGYSYGELRLVRAVRLHATQKAATGS